MEVYARVNCNEEEVHDVEMMICLGSAVFIIWILLTIANKSRKSNGPRTGVFGDGWEREDDERPAEDD